MHLLSDVQIRDFWDDHTVTFPLHRDVNFLIGRNGSGKTTAINLIAATLNADVYTLARYDFSQIEIKLRAPKGNKKPFIRVTKTYEPKTDSYWLTYGIAESSSETPDDIIVGDIDDLTRPRDIRYRSRAHRYSVNHLQRLLSSYVTTTWLSVHRADAPIRPRDERQFESSVDFKLDQLSNKLVRYFSEMDQRANQRLQEFQKEAFLSLLSTTDSENFISSVQELNADNEKRGIESIFERFDLSPNKYKKPLDHHFNILDQAIQKVSDKEPMVMEEVDSLTGTLRIHTVVEAWNRMLDEQRSIYLPRDTFIDVLNRMAQRKTFSISASNEIAITTQSGKILGLSDLSSGEKQLVIFLGESLLQRKQPTIYIADEPELSLHVDWQEQLIESLRSINPNSQILFATHSPDVVSTYGSGTIDMEKAIN